MSILRMPFIKKLILTILLAIAMPVHMAFGQNNTPNKVQWFRWKKEGQCTKITVGTKGMLSIGALALLVIFRADIKRVAAKLYF